MSRSIYEQLPDEVKFPFPTPDGTVTVDRTRDGDEYFVHDVELVDGPLFPLGRVVATTALLGELEAAGIEEPALGALLERHRGGDWGELPAEDIFSNDEAVVSGQRILSSYSLAEVRVWVITEWDRSVTTLLRPEDH